MQGFAAFRSWPVWCQAVLSSALGPVRLTPFLTLFPSWKQHGLLRWSSKGQLFMKFKFLVSLHYHFKMINQTFLFPGLQRGWGGRRAGRSQELVYLFPSSLCPFFKGVCPQNLQLSFSSSPLSQEVLKLSCISKTKAEQWCVKGFLIRPTEKYLPWFLCESGNFSRSKQENFVPQHWKNSEWCQFDATFWNPTDWNENCLLGFGQNWILCVAMLSIYWKFVKDCVLSSGVSFQQGPAWCSQRGCVSLSATKK